MKKDNKGFLLIETLIVTVFIVSTLIFLFVQFQRIESNYSRTFNYNTVDGLYRLANLRDYAIDNYFDEARIRLGNTTLPYLNLSTCGQVNNINPMNISEREYCDLLYSTTEVKTLILIDENTTEMVEYLRNITLISEDKKDFIRYINFDDEIGRHRLVVEFKDGTFATIKIF